MSLPRLTADRSGAYRAQATEPLLAGAHAHGLRVARIRYARRGGKRALLDAFAAALEFPDWFGGNWDALEDCLTDLSWIPAQGYLLLIEGFGASVSGNFPMLSEILQSAAQFWSARGKPFYAVFVAGPDSLPELGGATAG